MPIKGNTKLLHTAWDMLICRTIECLEREPLHLSRRVKKKEGIRIRRQNYRIRVENRKLFERKIIAMMVDKRKMECLIDDIFFAINPYRKDLSDCGAVKTKEGEPEYREPLKLTMRKPRGKRSK